MTGNGIRVLVTRRALSKWRTETLRTVPTYCEYADGPCDQSFENTPPSSALFLYPSEPPQIAGAIESAVEKGNARVEGTWRTWNELDIAGQIIFCSVCKSTRFAQHIVADVTTLNFNLLFEIGFAMGLELPVLPIRDTSFIRDKKKFEEFALLDTGRLHRLSKFRAALRSSLPCNARQRVALTNRRAQF